LAQNKRRDLKVGQFAGVSVALGSLVLIAAQMRMLTGLRAMRREWRYAVRGAVGVEGR
jgi:hypothetical protein